MRIIFLACLLCIPILSYAQCTVTDDTGTAITLQNPATRILSLAPDITEDLYAINAGANIVGVVSGSDYPQAATKLPIVGSYTGLDLEKIIELHPDLIVTWSSAFTRQTLALRRMNIPVYVISPVYLEDVPRTLKNLGCLTGQTEAAAKAATTFSNSLAALHTQYKNQKPVKVFYQIGSYSLMTINKKSWINQAIELCGGVNVFAQAPVIAPEVSWEAVIAANPDVIISDAQKTSWRSSFQKWPSISAVKNQRLYSINADLIDRAGPRLVEGVRQLCKFISLVS